MRKKRTWRYYCDYCNKAGCSAGHMQRHEKHCTLNPNRKCRMCDMLEAVQKPLVTLVAVFGVYESDARSKAERVTQLEELTEGCPACMLATARALDARDPRWSIDVEFKRRCKDLWDNVNAAAYERDLYVCHHG